jgi:hypothetical protein
MRADLSEPRAFILRKRDRMAIQRAAFGCGRASSIPHTEATVPLREASNRALTRRRLLAVQYQVLLVRERGASHVELLLLYTSLNLHLKRESRHRAMGAANKYLCSPTAHVRKWKQRGYAHRYSYRFLHSICDVPK